MAPFDRTDGSTGRDRIATVASWSGKRVYRQDLTRIPNGDRADGRGCSESIDAPDGTSGLVFVL